jgi:hypothetical protein
LNLAQFHAALTYHYDNPEEIDASLAEHEALDERYERAWGPKTSHPLSRFGVLDV